MGVDITQHRKRKVGSEARARQRASGRALMSQVSWQVHQNHLEYVFKAKVLGPPSDVELQNLQGTIQLQTVLILTEPLCQAGLASTVFVSPSSTLCSGPA